MPRVGKSFHEDNLCLYHIILALQVYSFHSLLRPYLTISSNWRFRGSDIFSNSGVVSVLDIPRIIKYETLESVV